MIDKKSVGLVDIYCGDSLEVLKSLPDNFVHCCVTSFHYYGLRDFRKEKQSSSPFQLKFPNLFEE